MTALNEKKSAIINPTEFEARSRVWIAGPNGTFLGQGRVNLLEAIHSTGSINKAAKVLKMSYTKAWKLIESMNSQSHNVLVERSSGGSGGGGTSVTAYGLAAIESYKALIVKCDAMLEKEMKQISL